MKKILIILLILNITGNAAAQEEDFQFDLYGFVRLESIYDQTKVAQGDWYLFVPSADDQDEDNDVFSMNARHTRIGVKMAGPSITDNIKTRGLIEVDFAGGFPNSATAARQPVLRLRHAWAEVYSELWSLRLGQDWALISGPFPNTANFVVGAGKGNLWMRYPQIKFTINPDPFKFAFSINRPMAGNEKYNAFAGGDFDPVLDGELTGMPWYMGRAYFNSDHFAMSVAGHYGTEDIKDLSATIHNKASYSMSGDATVKYARFTFTAKGFYGENLNSFLGGVFQGFTRDSSTVGNIPSVGGWANLKYRFSDNWHAVIGGGFDDPDDEVLGPGMRAANEVIWGNVCYSPVKPLQFILEGSRLTTKYIDKAAGTNLRIHFLTCYKF